MWHITVALALALCLPVHLAAAQAVAPASPLGMDPARIEYLVNEAPFVVFDISPRSLPSRAGSPGEAALTFVATDLLRQVDVFTSARPARVRNGRAAEPAVRTVCGSKIAGYYSCALTLPMRHALSQLQGGEGLLDFRIEAEGMEGDRSVVLITLPVKAATKGAPTGAVYSHTLVLLTAWPLH